MTMPSNKWEEAVRQQIAKIMVDYGVDFYEGNLMHRTEQRLSLIEDFQNDIVTALTNAVKELVVTAKPWREYPTSDFADGIEAYQANLLKAIGDNRE